MLTETLAIDEAHQWGWAAAQGPDITSLLYQWIAMNKRLPDYRTS